ncbi:MAG: hypothetical protein JST23_05285 [Bacteroidetes bacterium]|nr:hypothetical protein [Bacteroidota bacterium]
MKQVLILLMAGFLFASCGEESENEQAARIAKEREAATTPAGDSVNIRKVITDFYNWYEHNDNRLKTYPLYTASNSLGKPPFKINWDAVEKYQSLLRDSVPQLGKAFLENQKILLQSIDSGFKKNPTLDIARGFDFDWYTNSPQKPSYIALQIQKPLSWDLKRNGDEMTVTVKEEVDEKGAQKINNLMTLLMKKEDGYWKIAKTWEVK